MQKCSTIEQSKPSVFCRLTIDNKNLSVQTKTILDNDAPKFNQDFDLSISKRDGLTIEVLDVKRKKVICGAHLSSAKIERLKQQGGVQSLNLRNPKDQANSGVVYLEVNSRAPRRPSAPTEARSRPQQDQESVKNFTCQEFLSLTFF